MERERDRKQRKEEHEGYMAMNQHQQMADKAMLLQRLQSFSLTHNLYPTRSFSMHDDIRTIRFEVERLQATVDTSNNIGFMQDMLRYGCLGFEIFNVKLGLLGLGGWSKQIKKEMPRFRPILIRLYRRWFKKGPISNPMFELFIALSGSAISFHAHQGQGDDGPSMPSVVPPPAYGVQGPPGPHGRVPVAPVHANQNMPGNNTFSFDGFQRMGTGAPPPGGAAGAGMPPMQGMPGVQPGVPQGLGGPGGPGGGPQGPRRSRMRMPRHSVGGGGGPVPGMQTGMAPNMGGMAPNMGGMGGMGGMAGMGGMGGMAGGLGGIASALMGGGGGGLSDILGSVLPMVVGAAN